MVLHGCLKGCLYPGLVFSQDAGLHFMQGTRVPGLPTAFPPNTCRSVGDVLLQVALKADMVAINTVLADGLPVPDVDFVNGAVRRKDQQRNPAVIRLGHGRVIIEQGAARSTHQGGGVSGLLAQAQGKKCSAALIHHTETLKIRIRCKAQNQGGISRSRGQDYLPDPRRFAIGHHQMCSRDVGISHRRCKNTKRSRVLPVNPGNSAGRAAPSGSYAGFRPIPRPDPNRR